MKKVKEIIKDWMSSILLVWPFSILFAKSPCGFIFILEVKGKMCKKGDNAIQELRCGLPLQSHLFHTPFHANPLENFQANTLSSMGFSKPRNSNVIVSHSRSAILYLTLLNPTLIALTTSIQIGLSS